MEGSNDQSRFIATGFIDVITLTPTQQDSNLITVNRNDDGENFIFTSKNSTPSYLPGHYDQHRPVHVSCKEKIWEAFENFLKSGIPVKFANIMSFRKETCEKNTNIEDKPTSKRQKLCCNSDKVKDQGRKGKDTGTNKFLQTGEIPDKILDTIVTVQCELCEDLGSKSQSENRMKNYTSLLDKNISLRCINNALTVGIPIQSDAQQLNGENRISMFHGQDDQITTQMKFRDVMEENFDTKKLRVYVAQETIMSCRGNNLYSIACSEDGKLSISTKQHPPLQTPLDEMPFSLMKDSIRSPSYLLQTSEIRIREVNFWYAPQISCTNTHYDGYHNILVVYSGTKTVELNPPAAIKCSGIYSDHANHPRLLHPSFLDSIKDGVGVDQPGLYKMLNKARRARIDSTIVVSVSAGEGLFIPEGWWHRVESSASCMAVNYWFDHTMYSISSFKQSSAAGSYSNHLLPYYVRETMRCYIEEHFDDKASDLLKNDMLHHNLKFSFKSSNQLKVILCDKCIDMEGKFFKLLRLMFQIELDDTQTVIANTHGHYTSQHLSSFLLNLNVFSEENRLLIIKLLDILLLRVKPYGSGPTVTTSAHFVEAIRGLEPSSCFILTYAWEKQATVTSDAKYLVEKSYTNFMEKCNGKEFMIKNHLRKGQDSFRKRVAKSFVENELALC